MIEINLFCRSTSLNRNKLYDNMEQNDCLFNICITDRMENIFFEVLLGIIDENEQEKICDYIENSEEEIDKIIGTFCKKYHV